LKKLALMQSNYIPWKGYFDLINRVDDFVIYDEVQFTKNSWRNRNKIIASSNLVWLTVPVVHDFGQRISDVKIVNSSWGAKHWKTISQAYSKSSAFPKYAKTFEDLYVSIQDESYLSVINRKFIDRVCGLLNINTRLCSSVDIPRKSNERNERILEICLSKNADIYLSSPVAKIYLDVALFEKNGIQVEWMDYSSYEQYHQNSKEFVHEVSILDLIFNDERHCMSLFKQ